MNRIQLTDWAGAQLAGMHPDDQSVAIRVLDIIDQDSKLRESSKFDLNLEEEGKMVWGFMMARVWVAYIEEDDGSISILHLTMLSRLQHPDT